MKINDVLFIPKKGKVGFVYRENSANGKMSYITYFDEKGKLRKEISFEKWRDHNIGTTIFENIPTSGFKLLDNDKIYSTGYFGGEDHEKLIMFDPRGFEFSISVDNFVYLCSHGSLIDMEFKNVEFVYAWDKLQLVLLPSNSSVYRNNMEKLKLVNNKIKETEMLLGASYSFKKNDEKLIYIGKYYCISYDSYDNSDGILSKFEENQVYLKNIVNENKKEKFIFFYYTGYDHNNGICFISLSNLDSVAEVVDENAITHEELNRIISFETISDQQFKFEIIKTDSKYKFFENENYEFFIFKENNSWNWHINYKIEIFDKNKLKLLKEKDIQQELLDIVEELKLGHEELKSKYLIIGDKLAEVRF